MSNQRGDGDDFPAAAHLSEKVRGHKPESYDGFSHVGDVGDDLVRKLLSHLAMHYDPDAAESDMPATVEETDLYRMLHGREATETHTRAIHGGQGDTLSYAVGDPGKRSDVSGLHAIEKMEGIMDREAPIVYIYGEPGAGKTNIALLLAQIWVRLQERNSLDYEVASNIRTLSAQDEWIQRYSVLESWAKEYVEDLEGGGELLADDAPRKLYIFDEASSHAVGIGEQGYNAGMLLGPLVKTIRKGNCGIVIIGHDGKDVHPAVRTLSKVVRRYVENKKRATLYHSIQNRTPVDEIADLRGVPQTDWDYEDKEDTSFVWDLEASDDGDDAILEAARDLAEDAVERERRIIAAQLDLSDSVEASQADIGRAMGGYDQSWVSRAKTAYQNGDLSQDGDGVGML